MRKVKAFLLALITAACGSTADPDQGGDFDSNPDDSSSGGRAFAGAMAGMVAGCLIVGGCGGMDGGTETLPDGAAGSMMADAKGSNSKDGSMSDDSLNTNEAGSGGNAGAGGAGGDAGAPAGGAGGAVAGDLPTVKEVLSKLTRAPQRVYILTDTPQVLVSDDRPPFGKLCNGPGSQDFYLYLYLGKGATDGEGNTAWKWIDWVNRRPMSVLTTKDIETYKIDRSPLAFRNLDGGSRTVTMAPLTLDEWIVANADRLRGKKDDALSRELDALTTPDPRSKLRCQ